MAMQTKTMDLIKALWKAGSSLNDITDTLKSAGKALKNGSPLSKTYVKSIIKILIKKGILNKRPVVIKK